MVDNNDLKFRQLNAFDQGMVKLLASDKDLMNHSPELIVANEGDQVLIFKRGDMVFAFNRITSYNVCYTKLLRQRSNCRDVYKRHLCGQTPGCLMTYGYGYNIISP